MLSIYTYEVGRLYVMQPERRHDVSMLISAISL
jgi:hypothetical protein